MGSKEEAERAKRQGIILEKEQVKKQKLSEEASEPKTPTKEVSEDKIKEMMQLVLKTKIRIFYGLLLRVISKSNKATSAEETEPFKTDESAATPPPHPAYRTTARISIPAPVPMPAWTDSEVARLLAISSPPASPLSPWSSPPPQIPFPPLPPTLSPPDEN
nr:hypothetical protein [Tanacetum cinerariifolium]